MIHSLEAGGMERVMSELINGFVRDHNAEVHVVLYGMSRDVFYTIDPRAIVHKPNFEFLNEHRFSFTLKTMAFLRKELVKISPDAVLSFGEYWNNLVLLSLIGTSIPVFVSDRSSPKKNIGRIQNGLRKLLYPRSSGMIAQTSQARDIYKRMYRHDNFTVIGNPIRQIESPDSICKQKIVLSVGRLINTKHYDRLINIFVGLNRPDWSLVIVGGDSQKQGNMEKLRQLLMELGNPKNVILAGKQQNVEEYYNRSSIFAFTSSSEGFPNVVGEAMSAGLPVVSYDCVAGPSDMIKDGETGYLVPVFDDSRFGDKLLALMDDEELRSRMGREASRSIRAFDVKQIVQRYYDFITEIG